MTLSPRSCFVVTTFSFAAAMLACSEASSDPAAGDPPPETADAASGTSSDSASQPGPAPDAASPVDAAAAGGGFIAATIDGTLVNANLDAVARPGPAATLQLRAATEALTTSAAYKAFTLGVKNEVGTHSCATLAAASVNFGFNVDGKPVGWVADKVNGTCEIVVTKAAPAIGDAIEGTLSATLIDPQKATHTLTAGSFRVVRAQ